MATTGGQSGIDILCDAAGSDLLSSLLSLSNQPAAQDGQSLDRSHHPPPDSQHGQVTVQQRPAGAPLPSPQAPAPKRVKRKLSEQSPSGSGSTPSAQHACHICTRVYERADHLTRHLRAHENARPYACARCPKGFNRADLLTRHEATHDREGSGDGDGQRRFIRRSDRASEACTNCATSKAKCEDEKPCRRCRNRGLPCEVPMKRPQQLRTSTGQGAVGALHEVAMSPSETSTMAGPATGSAAVHDGANEVKMGGMGGGLEEHVDGQPFMPNSVVNPFAVGKGIIDDTAYFNPVHDFFQDMDFSSWDLNFDDFAIPQYEPMAPNPSARTPAPKVSSRAIAPDPIRGHEAFKRSPWLWDPEPTRDYVRQSQEGLTVKDESITRSLAFERISKSRNSRLRMDVATRDKLFVLVLAQNRDPRRVPSFPSLELLNYLLLVHFEQDEDKVDMFIHPGSFDATTALPVLLCGIVSHGATYIGVPAIWQFGMAMCEVVWVGVAARFEEANKNTRDLMTLQAYMLQLDVGLWSGFKRTMEIAEAFLQPLMTMLRRAGNFSSPPDSSSLIPNATDSREVLDAKWQGFVKRESFNRLALHVFLYSVQSSIALCIRPLMSFTELCFCLPASRDLFKANTAEQWRDLYLAKKPLPPDTSIPRLSETIHDRAILDNLADRVDVELCYTTMLHGFWAQISSYRESVKFYAPSSKGSREHQGHIFLQMQLQELYRDIGAISTEILVSKLSSPHLSVMSELFMMILHVSLDDLQMFAGKSGEEEARKVSAAMESSWAGTNEARYAIWHAGQVIRHARKLPPTALRDFNAIAVYYASLALWVHGLLKDSLEISRGEDHGGYVLLDGGENRETKAFLQLDRGTPALLRGRNMVPLSDPEGVLDLAREVFRDNFPVRTEPLPPLVEGLSCLLRDLGSGEGIGESTGVRE